MARSNSGNEALTINNSSRASATLRLEVATAKLFDVAASLEDVRNIGTWVESGRPSFSIFVIPQTWSNIYKYKQPIKLCEGEGDSLTGSYLIAV